MRNKINVLVIPSDTHGVGLYRSISPHLKLDELYGDEFNVEINYEVDWSDLKFISRFDIIHFHKGIFRDQENFRNALKFCKEHEIKTIMDIDDYWELPQHHPLYVSNRNSGVIDIVKWNLSNVDYVTTTTDIFAKKIKPFNKNVFVFPNAIDPNEEQYKPIKNKSDKIRFGFVMGSSHEKDVEQFLGVMGSLPETIREKIQVVLCGFDLRGSVNTLDSNGKKISTRPIMPTETVWFRYEMNLTDNYKLVSDEYRKFLLEFRSNEQYHNVDNEFYRREWTKGINTFATHYRNIDVLFAPLEHNQFNEVKSELKFIEAGFTHTAVIASNFGPYTIGSKNLFKYGGDIDDNGNCILIDDRKAHKDWAKAIKKLVENPELIEKLQNNMYDTVKDKYNINNVTKKRAEWYMSLVSK